MKEIIIYSFRENPFMKSRDFELGASGITISVNGKLDMTVRYDEIKSVRVYYDPRAYTTGSYQCKVYFNRGSFILGTLGYKQSHSMTTRRVSYSMFVNELIKRVYEFNPGVEIFAGDTRAMYWTSVAVIVIPIICLSGLFFFISRPEMPDIFFRVTLITFLTFLAFRYFRKNYPREIAAGDIPAVLLPKVDLK